MEVENEAMHACHTPAYLLQDTTPTYGEGGDEIKGVGVKWEFSELCRQQYLMEILTHSKAHKSFENKVLLVKFSGWILSHFCHSFCSITNPNPCAEGCPVVQ